VRPINFDLILRTNDEQRLKNLVNYLIDFGYVKFRWEALDKHGEVATTIVYQLTIYDHCTIGNLKEIVNQLDESLEDS